MSAANSKADIKVIGNGEGLRLVSLPFFVRKQITVSLTVTIVITRTASVGSGGNGVIQ